MGLSLVSNPWIAKNMSPEDYAISGYYTSFSSLISPIIIFYLVHFYIKEYFRCDENQRIKLFAAIAKALIWFSGIISILCFIGLFIYLKFCTNSLSFPILPYLALMVFALPLTGLLNLQLAKYRIAKRANAFFILNVSNGILNILCTIAFVVILKLGAFGKLLGPLICNAIVFIYMLYSLRKIFKIETSISEYKTIFLFCLPLALSAMLGYFTHGYSTTYLESIGDNTEYGIYIVGISIGAYITVFSTAVNNTFQPDIYESIIKKQRNRYLKFSGLQLAIIAIIICAFILIAPYAISLLTANRYVASTPYARISSIAALTSSLYYLINNYSIATNRPKLYLYTTIIGSLSIILLLPIAVKNWLYIGGAWISVLSFIIFFFINLGLLYFIKPKTT